MNELNDRFLSELFDMKQVRCHQDLYQKLFHQIWPCEWYFREFLSCSVTDLKIDYAKKIYAYLRSFEDVVLPEFTISNVISLQLHRLVTSNKAYTPQDHVIHSINLYITGVYLFFNFPLFHKRLLSQDSLGKTLSAKVKSFIRKWKIFSLYHDVGYYFESNVDCEGNVPAEAFPTLGEYRKTYTHLIFEYVTRSVARTILSAAIIQRSNRTFSCRSLNFNPSRPWRSKGKVLSKDEEIASVLASYEAATIVKDVQSDRTFSHFVMVMDKQKILIIIYDKDEYPIGYVERSGNTIDNVFVLKDSIIDRTEVNYAESCESLFDQIPCECTFRYCINNAMEAVYSHLPVDYTSLAKQYYKQLPEKLRLQITFASTDEQINQCFFDIYSWLIEKVEGFLCSDQPIPEYKIYRQSMRKYYEEAINNCLSSHIGNLIREFSDIETGTINDVLKAICESLADKKVFPELVNAIHENAGRSYSIEEGVSHDMLTYYAQTYHQVLRDFSILGIREGAIQESSLPDYLEMLQIMRVDKDNKIEIEIFGHSNEVFETELFNQIKKLTENLHIDFDKLTAYATNYTSSDHGLISAGLMFQAVVFSHYFAEYCEKHNDLKMAWYGLSGYAGLRYGEDIADYAEVIFSILLHNVYTYDSRPTYGIDYRHSIDEDPFSYFCAFCDTFQKWHRPKQIDYAKTGLPQNHFLGDKFDLIVTEDRICLKCNLQDAAQIRSSLHDENTYLPGILHFVQVIEQ